MYNEHILQAQNYKKKSKFIYLNGFSPFLHILLLNIQLVFSKQSNNFVPPQTLPKNQPRFVQHHKRKVVHKRIFPWQDGQDYQVNEYNRTHKESLYIIKTLYPGNNRYLHKSAGVPHCTV